ncbi:MAG: phosphomannomutase/phosphoglucomutase [Anaerolineales bacterium]|nr:phosphomannomutase/phosphoglucomutase [Anaerolineales bacterium]
MSMNLPPINPLIFREYDVRGLVDSDLKPEVITVIGKAIGTFIQNAGGKKMAIGRDNRESSETIRTALIEGLTASGCDVIDIGLSTSPLLYVTICQWGLDGGVNITGSHNPIQYNGLKIVREMAKPLSGEEIKSLYRLIMDDKLISGAGKVEQKDPKPEYYDRIANLIHLQRPMKVAVDTGNGIAGLTVPQMLKRIGCEVVELFTELDGTFPNHLPNPEHEQYLTDLKRVVVETGADIGMGFDGDGDRVGLIDEKGGYLSSDYTLILLARDFLSRHPGETVLVDIKSSRNVEFDIKQHGGKSVVWKTGHSLMKKKMWEDNIILGGEFSGHMFVSEDYFTVDDALYAAARILEMLSKSDKPLSTQFTNLPKQYSTPLIEVYIDEAAKFDTIKQLVAMFDKEYEVIDIDGAKVILPDGWGLVRASNTTPTLNLRFEADSPESLEKVKKLVFDGLKKFPAIKFEKPK